MAGETQLSPACHNDMTESKDTNPKDMIGIRKAPMSGLPAPVLMECGLVKLHGDLKYGAYNWREAGVRASVYYKALRRFGKPAASPENKKEIVRAPRQL